MSVLNSPVIIIGMHRSGTSLLAKVLEKAGIFMGVLKDHNYEAIHFLSLNQQTLWAANANWLGPKVPEREHYHTRPPKTLYNEHFKLTTKIDQFKYGLFPKAWGWKDPRNTFTLPMWLELFPKAKVIFVNRNSDAIALSLQKRNQVKGEVYDSRLDNLNFNLNLAAVYQSQAISYKAQLGLQFHEISYEDMVNLDKAAILSLEKFTGKHLLDSFKQYVKPRP